jgi:hypothetical protein
MHIAAACHYLRSQWPPMPLLSDGDSSLLPSRCCSSSASRGNVQLIADYKRFAEPPPISSLLQSDRHIRTGDCQTIGGPVERQLGKDDSLRTDGGNVRVFALGAVAYLATYLGERLVFDPHDGHTITAPRGPVGFRLAPVDPKKTVVLCRHVPDSPR